WEMNQALDEDWERIVREMAQSQFISQDLSCPAAMLGHAAWLSARLGNAKAALPFLHSIIEPLERAPGWAISYEQIAFTAAGTLWLLERTDHVDVIERNLREKILAPDFRYPMVDARLSLAHLCALQRRYEEAVEWFAAARTVLDEQGARPLR